MSLNSPLGSTIFGLVEYGAANADRPSLDLIELANRGGPRDQADLLGVFGCGCEFDSGFSSGLGLELCSVDLSVDELSSSFGSLSWSSVSLLALGVEVSVAGGVDTLVSLYRQQVQEPISTRRTY